MNKAKRKPSESRGVLKSRKLVQRRRNTCPSPQDITRALQSPSSPPSSSAASLDELIQRCLNCFDSEGKLSSPKGSQLVHMTLMMHSWVVPSQTFAQKLLALYKDAPLDKRGLRRAQICHLVRQWIGQFPAVFEADPLLEQTMGDLWALVRSDGQETHSQLIDTSCLNPHLNVSQAPSPSVKKRKVSLIFDHMEPDEMAEHLSYLEFKNFCNVSFLDYRSYVVRGSVRDNPALERSVMMCNGVSQWVQLMILSRHTAQQRAQVFTKFSHVAQKLRALQNFNTLMAVTGGLCHSSISRLKDTSNLLPPDITKALSEMTELLSSRSNYSNYRRVYNECSGFKVPILGVHLKDLISLNEALPDYIDEEKINLSKLQHLYSNINDLLAIHSCTPPFEANKDLLHLLTLSLDLYYTEDEIYELSYTKEPKNPKIQPVAPVKPPVVAEWGSGVTPRLDPDTISKHVKQMVDSIMKNYDQNQDGYITLDDFEKITANFPFSFCTHETDRLWDKLSQTLQGSGGNGVLKETQKHNWVLPMHPRARPQNQGQQLDNETDHIKGTPLWKNNTGDWTLSDRSTQTDPGTWTPQKKDKRGNNHNSLAYACSDRKVNTLPQRTRGCSMPVALLQEQMEELHLYEDKSREPD
uniref:RAS guanyl-releasing protein 4 isoform X5 n=1 Tax=Solea senegalensis TaxID=28829 RepID=UPI001CD8D17F|nr:RAS guanyl-releasing protein 4 isoform X5 [Solea senegalensis]